MGNDQLIVQLPKNINAPLVGPGQLTVNRPKHIALNWYTKFVKHEVKVHF